MSVKAAWLAVAALVAAAQSVALEFSSTARPAILHEAASADSAKVAVVSAGYPLEKITSEGGWAKVRDETGALAWIEISALGAKRTLMVSAPVAAVLEKPEEGAPLRFRAQRGVVLEPVSAAEGAWIKLRHASGQEGYARIRDLWGL